MPVVRRPLFLLPDLAPGGAERATLGLLAGLRRRGHEPRLVVLRRRGALLGEIPADLPRSFSLEGDASLFAGLPRVLTGLRREALRADAVVGALELEATDLAFAAAALARRPAIGWVHTVMSRHLPELSPVHAALARLVYPRLDGIVFPAESVADDLASVVTIAPGARRVIPLSIEPEALRARAAAPPPEWARPILAKPTIVALGRLVPAKGFDLAIRAHARARRSGVDHRLMILGEGRLRADLERLARELGVGTTAFLPGFVENPHPILAAARALVAPSRFEGFSLAILEAMALGVPVIATRCPGGPVEILEGGRHGLVVEPEDEAVLAAAFARLLGDPALAARLRRSAARRVEDFGSERAIALWEDCLASVGR